jgi:hypothetical protein
MSKTGYSRLAQTPEDYECLGLDVTNVAIWEDGQRALTQPGNFEWWYFDCHLEDGTSIVVVFYTKPLTSLNAPLAPCVTINITRPDGQIFIRKLTTEPEDFSASKDGCDVRIGDSRFSGGLNSYRIIATIEDVSVDIELTGEVAAWRPRTGHMYFGREGQSEKLFAWLPSVPQGEVKVSYTIGEERFEATGTGYHDHNWGDAPMQKLIHNWYWARAKIGPYTVIASYIIAEEDYGYQPLTVFLLAKDAKHVVDDQTKVVFATANNVADGKTGKPVAGVSTYTYTDGDTEFAISFKRQETIVQHVFADGLPLVKRAIAKVMGIDSAYMRFQGTASLEKRVNGELVERFEDPAIWEQMYFGATRTPDR